MGIKHSVASSAPGLIGATEWDDDHAIDGPLDLPLEAALPSPLTDVLKVFAQRRANRSLLRMIGQSGVDVSLQPAFFGNTIRMWTPSTGTTIGVFGQAALTAINSGTGAAVSTPAPGSGSDIAAMWRFTLGTGTVAGNTSGVRDPAAYYHRGSAAGRGGWFLACRFAVEVFASDIQALIGFTAATTALAGEASAYTNMAGIGKDSADSNWQFMHNDASGTATKINTTIAVNATDVLDFFCFAPPNSSSIFFELRNAMTGALLASATATTDLPVNTTMLTARASLRAPTSVTARQLSINKMYIETDL